MARYSLFVLKVPLTPSKQTNKQDLVFNSVDRDVKKAWWDCVKNDRESLALSQKDGQSRNKWRRRIKGATG